MEIVDGAEHTPRFRSWIVGVVADYEVYVRPIKSAVAMCCEPNLQAIGQRRWNSHFFRHERKGIAKPRLEPYLERSEITAGKGDTHVSVEKASIAVPDCRRFELVLLGQHVI